MHTNTHTHIQTEGKTISSAPHCVERRIINMFDPFPLYIIYAFTSRRLDYGNSLLYGLPDTDIQRLNKVQNTARRIVTSTRKYDHILPILRERHCLIIRDILDFRNYLMLAYKCLNHLALPYLSELLEVHSPARTLRSGESLNLKVPQTRLKTRL